VNKMKTIIHDPNNREIWCYGEIKCDSNFSVLCEDESNDCIVPSIEINGWNPETWQQVADHLYIIGFIDMEEISSC